MEIELRLLIAPADMARLRRFTLPGGWTRGAPKHKRQLGTYFDTEDSLLRQRGVVLRVRRDGRRWIQTVACRQERIEIEAQVASDHPDFSKIDDPALNGLFLSPELQQRIKPVFTGEFGRTTWLLESALGDKVEMALDQGEIRAGQSTAAISEVKLELKAGNPAALYETALALIARVPLRLENTSQAQRGYALRVAPAPPQPQPLKATAPDFKRNARVEQAFQAIARNCMGHLQCNHYGFLIGEDVEYAHQMRVAMRRLRSAIGLFAKISPGIRDSDLIGEIRWLAGELGAARDWDVLLTETLPPVLEQVPDNQAFRALRDSARAICAAKRESARHAANSPRYQKLLLRLGAWLNRAAWRAEASKAQLKILDGSILDASARLLDKRHAQLLRRGENLAGLSALERHALRIAGKKLRYAAEFLVHLYPGGKTPAYVKAQAQLQDVLGLLNDHVVTRSLLGELEAKGTTDALQAMAIGEIAGWNACQASLRLAALDQAWDDFRRQKRFWRK